jgi:hypothetical protein
MADLDVELETYRAQRSELESQFFGKWVVFHGTDRIGVFDAFEPAAIEAVKRFGRGPYLIREVGGPPVTLPTGFHLVRTNGRNVHMCRV